MILLIFCTVENAMLFLWHYDCLVLLYFVEPLLRALIYTNCIGHFCVFKLN